MVSSVVFEAQLTSVDGKRLSQMGVTVVIATIRDFRPSGPSFVCCQLHLKHVVAAWVVDYHKSASHALRETTPE